MINNIAVGKKIAEMRMERQLTQQTLAVIMGVSHQAVSKWENGTALPDLMTMQRLARFFGVTIEDILTSGEVETKEEPVFTADDGSEDADYSDFTFERLIKMAPFMSADTIDEIVMKMSLTPAQISKIAPFLNENTLEKLIKENQGEMSWDVLSRVAPFLKTEMVDSITRVIASGKKYVKPVMDDIKKTVDDIGDSIDIEETVSSISKKLTDFGNSLTKKVNDAIKTAGDKAEEVKSEAATARSAKSSLRDRIFSRALDSDNFAWIGEHIEELTNGELKEKIVKKAQEKGMTAWISEFFGIDEEDDEASIENAILSGNFEYLETVIDDADEETCYMIADAAVRAGRFEWLNEKIGEMDFDEGDVNTLAKKLIDAGRWDTLSLLINDYDVSDEIVAMIIKVAIDSKDFTFIEENIDEMDVDAYAGALALTVYAEGNRELAKKIIEDSILSDNVNEIALLAAEKGDEDMLDTLFDEIDSETAAPACLALADKGYLELAVKYIEDCDDDEAISKLIDMAIEKDDWDVIDKLNAML